MSDEIDGGGVLLAEQPPVPKRHHTFGDRVRLVLRGIGQTLITCGLVVLLFVVYEVWISNWFANRNQHRVHNALENAWLNGNDPLALPNGASVTIPLGVGIANLYIPRLGKDYAWTIVEGTNDDDLDKGPGHYVGTALPGQVGNFAIAGHRVGKGEPFLNLDHLRPGDAVVVETKTSWFVYRVKGKAPDDLAFRGNDDISGREIVYPNAGSSVIWPVPNHSGVTPTEKLMTMTTCHPKFTANQRMIVHAVLQTAIPTNGVFEKKPRVIEALYAKVRV